MPIQYFNGVAFMDGEIRLLESPKGCSTSSYFVQEMDWIQRESKTGVLDVSFSYDLVSRDKEGAIVKPVYKPAIFSTTMCGHHTRVADDALKLLLVELTCLKTTQTYVDHFFQAKPGQTMSIRTEGGMFRLRIIPTAIMATSDVHSLVIEDVKLGLEYEPTPGTPGVCESVYITWLEDVWIPQEARKLGNPFQLLKEVIVAQQLVSFATSRKFSFSFPVAIPPHIFSDPCEDLRYLEAMRKVKSWDAVEPGVGAAALVQFENVYQGNNIAVLLKKTEASSYETAQFVYNLVEENIQGMHKFGVEEHSQPVCPLGGVILRAQLAQKEVSQAFKQATNSVISLIPAIPDAIKLTYYSSRACRAAKNKDDTKFEEETQQMKGVVKDMLFDVFSGSRYSKHVAVKDVLSLMGALAQEKYASRVAGLVKQGVSEKEATQRAAAEMLDFGTGY